MALDPRQLKAFLAVAETGSLGRAADVLHLTQPALSRVVKRLEMQLQAQLFERRSNGMELTSFGQALLPYATHLTEEAELAIEEINVRLGLGRGTIRVGAVASAALMVLPAVVERLHAQWPKLRVQVMEAVEDKLALALTSNEIDVAVSGPMPESGEIMQVGEHKFTDRFMVIAAASHPLCARAVLEHPALLALPWTMPPAEAEPRKKFEALVRSLGATPPDVVVETRSPSTTKAIVAQTRILGWLPEPLFAAEQAAGLIRPLPCAALTLPRRFFVYRRRRNFMAPPLVEFLAALRG
jgi:DNA-binding transcriptional LysR family regulator